MAGPPVKVAAVTGGASGIGLAIAQRLARDGAPVGVLDLNGDEAEAAAAKIRADGGSAAAAVVDVADRASVEAATAASPS
jgi:2-hydroxycyclohexanecarboxyl-CoA dehydrogenase